MKEIGTSGAHESGGQLVSEERNPAVRGPARYLTFSNLLANVAIVAAGSRAFLNLVANSTWSIKPAETDGEEDATRAQEVADLVGDILFKMDRRPWSRVVKRAAAYRFYGFSIQEWTAMRRPDGTIGLLDVAPRPQPTIERWLLDEAGNVEGCTQRNPKTFREVFLPRGKIVHVVDDSLSDSPEGLGLFRHLVESHGRLERYQLLEAFGFETDLKGIPVGRAPYGKLAEMVEAGEISEPQRQKIIEPIEGFISQHIKNPELGLVLDSAPYRDTGENQTPGGILEWDVKLLSGSPASQAEMANAIERITREMALVLGVQGLLLGGDGTGSLALGRVQAEQFALIVDSALTELAEAFQKDLVLVILRLNGIDEALAPTLETELAQHRDVEQVTQALVDLATAGAPLGPDDPTVNTVLGMLGLPMRDLEAAAIDASLEREAAEAAREAALRVPEPPEPPPGPDPEPPEPPEPEA
jgi:hypothetical protein